MQLITGDIIYNDGAPYGVVVNCYGGVLINKIDLFSKVYAIDAKSLVEYDDGLGEVLILRKSFNKLDQAKLAVKATAYWGKTMRIDTYLKSMFSFPDPLDLDTLYTIGFHTIHQGLLQQVL